MSKISCNIIKDLLPSYMENICSEDTKEFVNQHLKECKDCSALVKIMQETELVSNQTDQKMADSMKKVKKHVQKMIEFGVLLGLIGIGMAVSAEYFGAVPMRPNEPDCVADLTKLTKMGFTCQWPWKIGLKNMIQEIE